MQTYTFDELIELLRTYRTAPKQTFNCVLLFASKLTGLSTNVLLEYVNGR